MLVFIGFMELFYTFFKIFCTECVQLKRAAAPEISPEQRLHVASVIQLLSRILYEFLLFLIMTITAISTTAATAIATTGATKFVGSPVGAEGVPCPGF